MCLLWANTKNQISISIADTQYVLNFDKSLTCPPRFPQWRMWCCLPPEKQWLLFRFQDHGLVRRKSGNIWRFSSNEIMAQQGMFYIDTRNLQELACWTRSRKRKLIISDNIRNQDMKKGSVSFYVLKQRARRELEETAAGRLLTCVGNNLQTDQSWARLYTLRGEICHCRHCRRQCNIFANEINFSIFTNFFCVFITKTVEIRHN